MQCKNENPGKGEFECLKEGRRVTRCARGVIDDINKSCLEQFRSHWACLEDNNHQLWQCRPAEWKLNKCVFENLVSVALSTTRMRLYLRKWDVLTMALETREGRSRPATELDAGAPTADADLRTSLHPARGALHSREEPGAVIVSREI